MGGRSSSGARPRAPWTVSTSRRAAGSRSSPSGPSPPVAGARPVFFTMADDPRVYAYVAATYLSQIFTVDGVR